MGNKQSRKHSQELKYSRNTAYLAAPRRSSLSGLSPELEELLNHEKMMGVASKLSSFADNLQCVLDVQDLASLSSDSLDGSGLTPLQRRRLIRAAQNSARPARRERREQVANGLRGVGNESPLILTRAGERRSKGLNETTRGNGVSSRVQRAPVPLRKRDSTSVDTPKTKLSKKNRQISTPVDMFYEQRSQTEIIQPNSVAVAAIESSVDSESNYVEFVNAKENHPPLSEHTLKRTASDPMLLDRCENENTIMQPEPLYLAPLSGEVISSSTPPPMSPTDSIGEHWSKHLPIRFILETIRNDVGNSDTLFAACQSLTQLVRQRLVNRKAAYSDGAISVISDALHRHGDADVLVEQGLRALARLCPGVPEAVSEIVSSGGIESTVNLVSRHETHGGLCRAACMLWSCIACEDFDSRDTMVNAGVIHCALKMLQDFSDPVTLMMACGVISCVLAQNMQAKNVLNDEEGLLSISLAMQMHLSRAKLQMYGCAAIGSATFQDNVVTERAYKDGIADFVIAAMRNHVTNCGVLLYGLKALANFVLIGNAWKFVLDCGIVDIILDACRAYKTNAALHLWACFVLQVLMDKGQGEAKKNLMEQYIVNWCIFIMAVHNESSEAYLAAKTLLHWFPPYNQFSLKAALSSAD